MWKELNFLHSDITAIILHGQILILYNWRPYLSITPRKLILPVRTVHMLRHNKAVLHGPGTFTTLLRFLFHLSDAYVYQRLGVYDRCDCVRKTITISCLIFVVFLA